MEDRLAKGPAWWLVDDGRVVAWGGSGFDSMEAAREAAREVRRSASGLDYRTQELLDHHWRWVAWSSPRCRVVVGMGSHLTQEAARRAAETTRHGLSAAAGPDPEEQGPPDAQ
ncbi:hypothetical protein [Nocardioides aestuarii]|uniref:DUF1508 domain-containing protein n=1 Tax=Nocardioides aestuarii TaxID=252231 RepID=A0ABW4TSP6_9ACTN